MIQVCYGETPPPLVLIGHGVGGAIAVHTASNVLLPTTVGLVAIDVVEGKEAPLQSNRCHADVHLSFLLLVQAARWRRFTASRTS